MNDNDAWALALMFVGALWIGIGIGIWVGAFIRPLIGYTVRESNEMTKCPRCYGNLVAYHEGEKTTRLNHKYCKECQWHMIYN